MPGPQSVKESRISDLRWIASDDRPADWPARIKRFGGAFHHSPAWLRTRAANGLPVFASLFAGDELIGIALGVRARCRISSQSRHYHFPTLPALGSFPRRDETLEALASYLHRQGAAEVRLGSFDACWMPSPTMAGHARARLEYVVSLRAGPDGLASCCGRTHRSHLRRGDREGWELRILEGDEAMALLKECVGTAIHRRLGWSQGLLQAARRAEERGEGFAVQAPVEDACGKIDELTAPWGVNTFSAWHDSKPLAAALVGWGGGRVFYISGGSTPEGYRRSVAVWLHWRIMCQFAERGFGAYNLGGTPESAARPENPAHGLFRFKRGFGAEIRQCRGAHRTLRRGHMWMHRLARGLQVG